MSVETSVPHAEAPQKGFGLEVPTVEREEWLRQVTSIIDDLQQDSDGIANLQSSITCSARNFETSTKGLWKSQLDLGHDLGKKIVFDTERGRLSVIRRSFEDNLAEIKEREEQLAGLEEDKRTAREADYSVRLGQSQGALQLQNSQKPGEGTAQSPASTPSRISDTRHDIYATTLTTEINNLETELVALKARSAIFAQEFRVQLRKVKINQVERMQSINVEGRLSVQLMDMIGSIIVASLDPQVDSDQLLTNIARVVAVAQGTDQTANNGHILEAFGVAWNERGVK